MDLTIRDWMVIIGVLLIAAVLVDAWRRVRRERSERVRVKIARTDDGTVDEALEHPSVVRELPNGGARVVKRDDLVRAAREHSEELARGDDSADETSPKSAGVAGRKPTRQRRESAGGERPVARNRVARSRAARSKQGAARAADSAVDDGLISGVRGERREPANLDWLDDLLPATAEDREPEDEGRLPRDPDPEVFMLHVVCNDPAGFRGEDIMHILLACDLRFGDMNFFHRHEQPAGRGPIQFSVANMMQPGVFDIDRMTELKTQGLLFFVTLPGPEDMMKAFDYMLETAQTVARNLGGSVLDETRSAVTPQTLEHSRQKIRELERRMLARGH